MLEGPGLNSLVLHLLVLQKKPERGHTIFPISGQTLGLILVELIFKHILCPQNSKAWLFFILD